jgi:hypothetical protein
MNRLNRSIVVLAFLLGSLGAVAQQSSNPPAPAGDTASQAHHVSTVRGCLNGERANYVLVEEKTGMVYVLKGVGSKLDGYLHHEVEATGRMLPGTIKTGLRPEKEGSNPSDTVHGVDGVPLQVADVQNDVRMISKKCKAADEDR